MVIMSRTAVVVSDANDSSALCRLCMECHEYYANVFIPNDTFRICAEEAIHDLLRLKVTEGDGLPSTVCHQCLKKLIEFRDFKEMCLKSDAELRKSEVGSSLTMKVEDAVDPETSRERSSQKNKFQNDVQVTEVYVTVPDELAMENICHVKGELMSTENVSVEEGKINCGVHCTEGDMPVTTLTRVAIDPLAVGTMSIKEEAEEGEELVATVEGKSVEGISLSEILATQASTPILHQLNFGNMWFPVKEEVKKRDSMALEEGYSGRNFGDDIFEQVTTVLNVPVNHPVSRDVMGLEEDEFSSAEDEMHGEEDLASHEVVEAVVPVVESKTCAIGNEVKPDSSILQNVRVGSCFMPKGGENECQGILTDSSDKQVISGFNSKIESSPAFLSQYESCSAPSLPSMIPNHQETKISSSSQSNDTFSTNCTSNLNAKKPDERYNPRPLVSCGDQLTVFTEYICDYCEMKCTDKNALIAHIQEHMSLLHGRSKASVPLRGSTLPRGRNKMFKPLKRVRDERELNQGNSSSGNSNICKEMKTFTCNMCGKIFKRSGNYNQHLVTHSTVRKFKCEKCGKEFKRNTTLVQHYAVHTDEKPFKCGTCGEEFNTRRCLSKHSAVHKVVKPYKCDTCGREYKLKGSLVRHVSTHFGAPKFTCEFCGKSFYKKSCMTAHRFIHTGKPFKCTMCGRGFISKYAFNIHVKTHFHTEPFNFNLF